jgi:hypothetical protein
MARAAAEYAASTAGDPSKAPKEAKLDPDAIVCYCLHRLLDDKYNILLIIGREG